MSSQPKITVFLLVLALALASCGPLPAQPQPASPEPVHILPTATESDLPLPVARQNLAVTPFSTAENLAASSAQETYCLWPGDTFYDISLSAKVPADSILAENGNDAAFAGSAIRLPAGSIPPAQWVPAQPGFDSMDQLPMGVSGFYLGYDNRKKQVALTFDVGYEAENTQLIKMLAERGIRATF